MKKFLIGIVTIIILAVLVILAAGNPAVAKLFAGDKANEQQPAVQAINLNNTVPEATETPVIVEVIRDVFVPTVTNVPNTTTAPAVVPTIAPFKGEQGTTGIKSSDLVLVGENKDGVFTYAIYEADLKKVNFVEVNVTSWDGVKVVRNTKGVICSIWGKKDGQNKAANDPVTDKAAQKFFNSDGELKSANVRHGSNNTRNCLLLLKIE